MYTCALPANSLSRLYVSADKAPLKRYYAVVPTSDIPQEWANWLGVNARDYSEKGRVPKAIRATLRDNPGWFAEYNRGITLVVHDLEWDNKANILTLQFEDINYHGVLDGGHTLSAILDTHDNEDEQASFCNLEIFTDLDKAEIPNVVEARNTSKQVASQSLLNLAGSFDPLKKALGAKADLISWRENEEGVFRRPRAYWLS